MPKRKLILTTVLTGFVFLQAPAGGAEGEGAGPHGPGRQSPSSFGALDLENRPAIREPDRRDRRPGSESPARVAEADAACSPFYQQIRTRSGDALVEAILNAPISCIADLEWIGDQPQVQYAASGEDHVVDVARAIPGLMSSYGAEAGDMENVDRLFLYLDMARDIHGWCREQKACKGDIWRTAEAYSLDVGSRAGNAVRDAFEAYTTHSAFMSQDEYHADILYRVISMLGRFPLPEHFLDVVTRWLRAWDEDYAASSAHTWAMKAVLDIAYSCHRRAAACGPAYGGDGELFRALRDFVVDGGWLGSGSDRLLELATIELGRFGAYPGTPNYGRLPAAVRSVRNRYGSVPEGRLIWLRIIASLDYNDSRNCRRYGLCDWYGGAGFHARFRRELFNRGRTCRQNACPGDTVSVRSQNLSGNELDVACRRLNEHSRTFASMFATRCKPVPGDVNARLDLFVFQDGVSCEDFESAAFGGHPDSCSGISWEGNESSPGSALVATEKEPGDALVDPELAIWNFEHEYAHYLDARYNRHGPFTGDPAIQGWSEGVAEYFANSVTEYHHGKGRCSSTHSLTDTLLLSGSIPTSYNQRHIMIRFLMEHWSPFVDVMLLLMRHGRYDDLKTYIAREAPRAEAAWESWLGSGCVRPSVAPPVPSPPPDPEPPPEPDPDPEPPVPGPCDQSGQALCLRQERFEVKVDWWTDGAEPSPARAAEASTDDSGLFWFVSDQNWEILIKVLDGCESNGHVWVYGAATTDLGYSIRVRDTVTGTIRRYGNEPGRPSPAVIDSRAFADACRTANR